MSFFFVVAVSLFTSFASDFYIIAENIVILVCFS